MKTLDLSSNEAPIRVTVLMPFHRLDPYLELAVQSILDQSFPDFELLLIADTRLLGQEKSIMALAKEDPRVRLLPSLPVGGLAAGLNIGIAQARGEYIARMDSDDISMPNRLAAQVTHMDKYPEIAVLGSRLTLIDEGGLKIRQEYPYYENDQAIRSVLPLRNPMPHPALMFRRTVLIALGGYKYAHSAEDWELLIRLARNRTWQLHNLDATLVLYRRHASQITRPELTRTVFLETSAFLFAELLRTGSPKYAAAMLIKLPLLVRVRLAWRKLRGKSMEANQT